MTKRIWIFTAAALVGSWRAAAILPASLTLPCRRKDTSASDIYLDKCSVCHGADGAGKTAKGKKLKVKDVRETIGTVTADQMIVIVTKGKGDDMDAFAKS